MDSNFTQGKVITSYSSPSPCPGKALGASLRETLQESSTPQSGVDDSSPLPSTNPSSSSRNNRACSPHQDRGSGTGKHLPGEAGMPEGHSVEKENKIQREMGVSGSNILLPQQ